VSFTEHFRRLETTRRPDELFLAALGKALRGRLRHAGLWDQPPAFLGYDEFRNWADAFADGDAVADPTLDCYLEAVVRRYDSLADQLRKKDNIDGLIYLNVKRFILERQKKHDPIGYSAFKNLEAVLEKMAADKQVSAEQRVEGRLRNESLVLFPSGERIASREQLEEALSTGPQWDQALPRQVKIGEGAQRLLLASLTTLPEAGVAAFRLGDLVNVLKDRVRHIHAQRNRPSDSEVVPETRTNQSICELIRIVRPDPGYEEGRENLQHLLRRMRNAIDLLDAQERTRTGLRHLLDELSCHAETDEEIPSWAELSRRLGVRRTTLWDHLERLRELAKRLLDEPDTPSRGGEP
jgi:hypothetical protein